MPSGSRTRSVPATEMRTSGAAIQPAHLAAVVLRGEDQLARHDAFGEDAAVVVDVREEEVERGQPLRRGRG